MSLVHERVELGTAVLLRLTGVLDERFDAGPIFRDLPANVVLDLAGIKRITSFGVRQWSDAMKGIPARVQHLYVLRAPACFVDQLNMVLNFGGRAEVVTATALYFCDKCQEERAIPIDVLGEHALLSRGGAPPALCPTCGTAMALEDDPQQAFRYVAGYGCKVLDDDVGIAIAKEGLYAPRKIGPPPEEMKLVHGEVTLLVLSGTLDQRFRPRRLAAGVEGEVLLDLGGVGAIDATGVERFRQLLSALESQGSVTLVDVPESILREVATGSLPLGAARLVSVLANFQCASCGSSLRASVRREEGASSRPPCERCGEPTQVAGSGPFIERAFKGPYAPPPARVEQLIGQRAELVSRARVESGTREPGPATTALGRYRVLRPLSRGGMAEILLAVHEGIGGFEKLIALKKIRRKLLERRHVAIELFLNEAKIVANLNHPNIVQTFEVGEHGGDLFIAMEYVHGVDARTIVKHRVESKQNLSIEQILYVGTLVAAALDHAHKARDLSGRPLHIVHRDVSLSNIVIGFDGQVKLVDFGIATAASVVQKGGLIGKFSYMSPEQVKKEPLDGRSDVFSLGIVMYELIAGKPLFRRGTDEETLKAVCQDALPSLAEHGVPPEVEAVLFRALERSREARYADARALELALQGALQRLGGQSAHQLSLRMRELFPEESAAAPTAVQSGATGVRNPSPSSDSGSGSPSEAFMKRSQTFEARIVREQEETHPTSDATPVAAEPGKPVPAPTATPSSTTPQLGVAAISNPGPPISPGTASARRDETPVIAVRPVTPAPVPVPEPAQARRGEGVHFNRSPKSGGHGTSSVSIPTLPASPQVEPTSSNMGRTIVIVLLFLAIAVGLAWLFLRG